MANEFFEKLFKRKSQVESGGQVWESAPAKSTADASNLQGLDFSAPTLQAWLKELEATPEDDKLAEALAEEFAERRQRKRPPSHVLAGNSEGDAKILSALTEELAALQKTLEEERNELGSQREELQKREAEIQERQKALEEERSAQQARAKARQDYPQPKWLENLEGTINIGVVGNSGVGKSLLINKIRRVRPQAHGWAPVGVKETTREPTMYQFLSQPNVRLWDLPGAGTEAIPSSTYIQDMGLRYFDKVLILTAHRFTSMEVELRKELEQHKVPYFLVRTKIDIDIWNNQQDNNCKAATTMKQIRRDLNVNHGVEKVFLISARDPDGYDMPALVQELFPGLKRGLDPEAPEFNPGEKSGWEDGWSMPVMYSPTLSAMQGRWRDAYGAYYNLSNNQVHVTLSNGQRALVQLTERGSTVSWCDRWYVNEELAKSTRLKGELRWAPSLPTDPELVWWWCD
mmetsp:Transcript_68210/g.142545  ORF Transcript_68210/g.142545 Transcript_68210/m.142545 type:complete len:459 (-) Transcript_68210:55-1431(-)